MGNRLYLETTIISYLAARLSRDLVVAAHQQLTHEWWDNHRHGFDLFSSQLVEREAAAGDEIVARKRLRLLSDTVTLDATAESQALTKELLGLEALPENASDDAAHIAIATVHGMDYLLTWNCRHIANARLHRAIKRASSNLGFELPIICTPEELIGA